MPRSRRSPRAPSGCASRCICGSGGLAGDAGAARRTARGRRRLAAEALATGSTARRHGAAVLRDPAARDPPRAGADRRARAAGPGDDRANSPGSCAWRAALATLLCETGREARRGPSSRRSRRMTSSDIPRDGDWLIAITLLADCAPSSATPRRAQILYELLPPYRDVNVVIGLARSVPGLGRAVSSAASRRRWAPRRGRRALRAGAGRERGARGAGVSRAHAARLRRAARRGGSPGAAS